MTFPRLYAPLLLLAGATLLPAGYAQAPPQSVAPPPATQTPESMPQAEAPAVVPPPPGSRPGSAPPPVGLMIDRAWSMLTSQASPDAAQHRQIEAMAALGTMGENEHAARLISQGMRAKHSDVRLAAVLAAGQTKNPRLIPSLRETLNDEAPQVAYAAATTLWKMHDYSGEDLLVAVAEGDRKTKPGLIKSSEHKASKELHSPKTLALLGIENSAGYFLGPFGVGIKAIQYVDKNNGGAANARAQAINMLAENHTEAVHQTLIDGLDDKEPVLRAASAKGLGNWPGPDTARQLAPLFDDGHAAVRLTAAAAYIRAESQDVRSESAHPEERRHRRGE